MSIIKKSLIETTAYLGGLTILTELAMWKISGTTLVATGGFFIIIIYDYVTRQQRCT
jgi:hypothetical protein